MQSVLNVIVCPSVTRVDQSKMVEVRIMQLSPQSNNNNNNNQIYKAPYAKLQRR